MKLSEYDKYLKENIPYKFGGEDMDGFDCIGLVVHVAKENGITIPNVNHSNKTIKSYNDMMKKELDAECWVEVDRSPNVCVTFITAGVVNHIGWMIDNSRFIHIQKDKNVMISKISDSMWKKRLFKFYMYKGK